MLDLNSLSLPDLENIEDVKPVDIKGPRSYNFSDLGVTGIPDLRTLDITDVTSPIDNIDLSRPDRGMVNYSSAYNTNDSTISHDRSTNIYNVQQLSSVDDFVNSPRLSFDYDLSSLDRIPDPGNIDGGS